MPRPTAAAAAMANQCTEAVSQGPGDAGENYFMSIDVDASFPGIELPKRLPRRCFPQVGSGCMLVCHTILCAVLTMNCSLMQKYAPVSLT